MVLRLKHFLRYRIMAPVKHNFSAGCIAQNCYKPRKISETGSPEPRAKNCDGFPYSLLAIFTDATTTFARKAVTLNWTLLQFHFFSVAVYIHRRISV